MGGETNTYFYFGGGSSENLKEREVNSSSKRRRVGKRAGGVSWRKEGEKGSSHRET